MTFATRLAQANKPMPISVLEFDGDLNTLLAADFAATTKWTAAGQAANVSVETTNAKGLAGAIKFDKSGTGGPTGSVASTTALESIDLTQSAYETLEIYLSSVADVASVTIRRGSDGSNYWEYEYTSLVAGWNTLFFDASQESVYYSSTTGTPSDAATDYLRVGIVMNASGDTLTGIIFTPPRQHPYRYSTSKVTSVRAPTKTWMTPPAISPNVHDPVTAVISSASATCVVVDDDGATVVGDMAAFAFQQRGVRIRYGFAGDAETDDNYSTIFRGTVQSFAHIGKAWSFDLADNLAKFRRPFAQDATDGSPYTITGNILDVFLKLATSTGNGTNGDYDTETAVRGAGISSDLFDVSGIEAVRDDWRFWAECSFTFQESQESLLEFFFVEVCLGFSMVPIVTGAGLLSVRAPEEGLYPGASMQTLGASNIIAEDLPEFVPNSDRIRNQVRVLYDYNVGTDAYASDTGDDYNLADSTARYGLRELVVRSKGIISASVAEKVARSHFYRIGEGSPPAELRCFMSQQARELGELVELTTDLIPDIEAGAYSISGKIAEIESRAFSPDNPETRITVGITSYRRGKYRLIGPSSLPDYDSQTASQKAVYGSIADTSQQLGAANDPAHEIGA